MNRQVKRKGTRKPQRLPEVLSREEALALIRQTSRRAPSGVRNRAALLLMYRAGLRESEVSNLRPQDVVLDNAHPRVIVRQGKNLKDRTVPLPSETTDTLLRWQEVRRKFAPRAHWLFCSITEGSGSGFGLKPGATRKLKPGAQVSTAYWRQLVARLANRAGIERRVHPHQLRHSFATEKLREGWDLESLRVALGHSSLTTTQVYVHVDEARLAELQARAEPLPL